MQISFKLKIFKCNKVELNFLKLVSRYVLFQELKVKVTVLRECEFYKYLELWTMHEKLGRRARDEQKEAF